MASEAIDYLGMFSSGFCEQENKSSFLFFQPVTFEPWPLAVKGCDLVNPKSGLAHCFQ